jgi:hypothetical protein
VNRATANAAPLLWYTLSKVDAGTEPYA